MIPVCILLLLWFLKALKRFIRVLTVRVHFLRGDGNDMIEIQGLGSYLMYFDEVSRIHTSAIVHTRQTKPAILMSTNFVPITLHYMRFISSNHQNSSTLEISLQTPVAGKLMLLSHFDVNHFKQAIQQGINSSNIPRSSAKSPSGSSSSLNGGHSAESSANKAMIQWVRRSIFHVEQSNSVSGITSVSRHDTPWLVSRECCNSHTLSVDVCSTGPLMGNASKPITVQFDVSSLLAEANRSRSRSRSGSGTPQSLLRFRGSNNSNNGGVILDASTATNTSPGQDQSGATQPLMNDFALVFVPTIAPRDMIVLSHAAKKVVVPQSLINRNHQQNSSSEGEIGLIPAALRDGYEDGISGNENTPSESHSTDQLNSPSRSSLSSLFPTWLRLTQSDNHVNPGISRSSSVDPNQIEVSTAGGDLSSQAMEMAIASIFTFQMPVTQPVSSIEANPVHSVPNSGTAQKNLYPKDLFFIDHRGQLLHSLEIFGLNPVNAADSTETVAQPPIQESSPSSADGLSISGTIASKPISSGSPGNTARIAPVDDEKTYNQSLPFPQDRTLNGNNTASSSSVAPAPPSPSPSTDALLISQGGKFPKDECVICLTELREIMLLPCR